MATHSWPEKEYSVMGLLLDPRNPRLPDESGSLSQAELIADLVEHDEVYELAKDIVDKGYYPVERIVVVREGNSNFVVEGNRRVAALKLLINPDLAPDHAKSRFKAAAKSVNQADLKRIKAVVAPSREEAYGFLLTKHTQTDTKKWSRVQQARFYNNLLVSGISVDLMAKAYSISKAEVLEFLQMHEMYAVACRLDLPPEVKAKVDDNRRFPLSTLKRVYDRPAAHKFLGISFDAEKRLKGRIHIDEFRKGYSRIVTDIAGGDEDSRTLNTNSKVDGYLKRIKADKANANRKGSFTVKDFALPARGRSGTPRKRRVTWRKRKGAALIPRAVRCTVENERIRAIVEELKSLDVARYPNAVSTLFRPLLEMSLYHHLERTGLLKAMIKEEGDKAKKKGKSLGRDYCPTMHKMMVFLLKQDPSAVDLDPQAHRAIQKSLSVKETIFAEGFLHAFIHNKYAVPSESVLRGYWDALCKVFEVTLVEPPTQD